MSRLTNQQLLQALWDRRHKLADIRDDLARTRGWSVFDARITVLTKLEHVIGSTALGFECLTEFLLLPRHHRNGILHSPISDDVKGEFVKFFRLGFVQLVFSAIESAMRLLLRKINPVACNGATTEFKSVYDCLLRTELRLEEAQNWVEMLDLFRLIRNTLHNNGVYFHKSCNSVTVPYRGKTYEFKHGEKIDFVFWDLKLSLLDDVIWLVRHILDHPRVVALDHTRDPFAP